MNPESGATVLPARGSATARGCFTFGSRSRIKQSARFDELFTASSKRVGRFLVVWAAKGSSELSRLGVVTSKRSLRLAVDRNRARRLVREAFRHLAPEITNGVWDVLVVARSGAPKVKEQLIREDLRRIFAKLGILTVSCHEDNRNNAD